MPTDVAVTNSTTTSRASTLTPTSGLVTTEAGGTATFQLSLSSQPLQDVVVTLTSSDTTEGTVSPGERDLHGGELERRRRRSRSPA